MYTVLTYIFHLRCGRARRSDEGPGSTYPQTLFKRR